MRQKLCKQFLFEERRRSELTFSDATKIRLNPKLNQLQLAIQSYDRVTGAPVYPTDTDLTVTTWITNPSALTQWLGFEMVPLTPLQPANTQVRFKLNDGTNDRYWDGGSWAIAGATDWNTEAEVSANISQFPVADQKLGFVVNLVSTDGVSTPTVKDFDILYEAEIDYLRSIIVDSLLQTLIEEIQPEVDLGIRAPGGTRVFLRDIETPFNISSMNAVYNLTTDPNRLTNLLSSYDSVSKTATLTASVARGTRLVCVFTAEPEGYLEFGSQDYTEVHKVPAVVIESVDISGNTTIARFEVRDLNTNTATVRELPFRLAIEFEIVFLAEKNATLLSMMDQSLGYLANNHKLLWRAVDDEISMFPLEQGLFRQRPTLRDQHANRITIRLENIYLWLREEQVKYLVQRYNITASDPSLQGGVRWTGTKTG